MCNHRNLKSIKNNNLAILNAKNVTFHAIPEDSRFYFISMFSPITAVQKAPKNTFRVLHKTDLKRASQPQTLNSHDLFNPVTKIN